MTKLLILFGILFLAAYCLYCFVESIMQSSFDQKVTFVETFINRLGVMSICFTISITIIFALINLF